jgi:epoxyqueuosine reductase
MEESRKVESSGSSSVSSKSLLIREKALALGYDDVGITPATLPFHDKKSLTQWLRDGHHADLKWMESPARMDPTLLFPGAKSAILFITNYKQPKVPFQPGSGVIASYARGRDYHHLHRKRIKAFICWLEELVGETGIAKGFSDSSPIMERALAVQAGLGFMGKNNLLIHRKFGTFTLISGVLTTLPLDGVKKEERLPRCGPCTKCIDACPTGALTPYALDAKKCLSYHLIESKNEIPEEIRLKNPGYAFGCDLCQDACPHNVRSPLSREPTFSPESGMGPLLDWEKLEQIENNPSLLFGTPLQRRKGAGLRKNLGGSELG